jgi:uncharacterized membrane protein HdeD (DUF308 family)
MVGAALLGTAVLALWLSLTTRDGVASARVLGVIVGLSLLVTGVLCLRESVLTITVLTLALGLSWLVGGVVEIHRAVRGKDDRLVTGVGGVVILLAGIVVLAFPLESAVAVVWLLGAGLVTVGGCCHRTRDPSSLRRFGTLTLAGCEHPFLPQLPADLIGAVAAVRPYDRRLP